MSSVSSGPQAVLWDNDGVLVDTERLFFEATRDALAEVGIELTIPRFVEISLRQGRAAWDLARDAGVAEATIRELRAERDRVHEENLRSRSHALPGVEAALRMLRPRFSRMVIVTSAQRAHLEAVHEPTGLLRWFDATVSHGEYARSKPHPDPYLLGAERAGHPPERCVAVEDSPRGLRAALAAGIPCFVVKSDLNEGQDFSGAIAVCEDIAEVAERLSALVG